MCKNYTVSVVIPCYNKAHYIYHTVSAILNQTIPPDEIVVVDDASEDASPIILQHLPVKLIRHERNQGPAAARNTALSATKGDIIVFIDADAYADYRLIEVFLRAYNEIQDPRLGGVGGRGIECNINTIFDRWRALHARQDFGLKPREVPYLFGLCASYKREVLLQVGGFDTFFPINAGEDVDLGYRIRKAGYKLYYIPDAKVYHQHSDTERSLLRIQYNWFYWTYLAKKRANLHPWTLFAGTLRRLFTDTLVDLLLHGDIELALLDLKIFKIKMHALFQAFLGRRFDED
jgi:glycosyltransferase involved in cell wall biosynthesis